MHWLYRPSRWELVCIHVQVGRPTRYTRDVKVEEGFMGLGPELSKSLSSDRDVGHQLQVIVFGVPVPSPCATVAMAGLDLGRDSRGVCSMLFRAFAARTQLLYQSIDQL